MTGVEAVSNGVPAFKPPEARNAAATMVIMAVLAITMFIGITLLAHAYGVMPSEQETVISQLARGVFDGRGLPYYLVQAATMLILVLAANTAYADFPRLASILARDRYLPRQFMNQGDRLAFSNGILGLSALAAVLLIAFRGDTHALIPLYMIGVFVSFTLSQAGMVLHWRTLRGPGWKTSAAISASGAIVTGIVLVVVAVTKAHEGAWIIMLVIPVQVVLFRITRTHYNEVAAQLTLTDWQPDRRHENRVIVPISGVQRAVVGALDYARTLSSDVRAVYIDVDPASTAADTEGLGQMGPRRSAGRAALALSIVDGAPAGIHRTARPGPSGRLRDGRATRIRACALVASSVSQPARAAYQSRPVVQATYHRDERAVSPGALKEMYGLT